jgi:CubicO group peptidase (beta-lactamase class C family)
VNRPVFVDGSPGSGFRYSNGDYLILAQIVTDVMHEDLNVTASDLVFKPLQMTRSTFEVFTPTHFDPNTARGHDTNGVEETEDWRIVGAGEGRLWTTATDLAKEVLAIQRSVQARGGFLSQPLARQMTTRQDERWGLGVQVDGEGVDSRFQHDGSMPGYKAKLFGYRDRGQGVVILTSGDRGGELIDEVMYSVAADYGWPDSKVT